MKDAHSLSLIATLHPAVRLCMQAFVEDAETSLGFILRITSALRTIPEQNELYTHGRTNPGPIVTNARGGSSFHNYGLAIDVCPIMDGKLNWNYDFSALAPVGARHGLEWGGSWKSIKDYPHFQKTFGHSWQQLYRKYVNKHFLPGSQVYLTLDQ